MKTFLMYWGYGYGDDTRTSEVHTHKEMLNSTRWGAEILAWCRNAKRHEEAWHFSGPTDQFLIKRVE
jgi:hypothetical protein